MELPGNFAMDRLAAAILIVITALVFHGGFAPGAFAKEKRFAMPTQEQALVTADAGSSSADRSAAF